MYRYFLDGGMLMFPLLFCSIFSFFWFFYTFFLVFNVRKTIIDPLLLQLFQSIESLEKKSYKAYSSLIFQYDESLFYSLTSESLDDDEWIDKKIDHLNHHLTYLNQFIEFIIRAAPIIGILGTVIGIIITFDALDVSSLENFDVIINGISQALNTTAFGLFISIFSIIFLNIFNFFIERKMNYERVVINNIITVLTQSKK